MKLIRKINDLNKALKMINELGFVPTMGGLHNGHKSLIKISKSRCKKTLVSIFVNPTQFNNKNDYKTYPSNLDDDLKILKRLNVDYVYIPTINQIYNKKTPKITLKKRQKILCAKFRKGHFEGVLDVLNRFTSLILPKTIFMGEKDFQQFFLVKNFIEKKFRTKVHLCKTMRNLNKVALSTRNKLVSNEKLNTCGSIAKKLFYLKILINKDRNNSNKLIRVFKEKLILEHNIKIEYLESRNLINLNTNIIDKPYKIFIAYYLNNIRFIDNF